MSESRSVGRTRSRRGWAPLLHRGERAALVGVLVLSALGACSGGESLPAEYLGRWYYMGSSGGMDGAGMGDPPTGYVEVHSDNVIVHYREDGTLIGTSEFELSRGSTIYSNDEQWVLTFGDGIDQVIWISESGTEMSLSDNVYDGFGRSYARSR